MAYDIRFDVKQTGAETIDQINAKLVVMKTQISGVASEMTQAAKRVTDAEQQMAAAVASGHGQLAATLSGIVAKERAELETLVAKHRELKASVDEVTSSFTRQMPAVQALNAEFSMMEGRLPTRALGSLANSIGGLGPLMQGLFPIFAAGMFVDLLGQVVGKLGDIYNKWDPVVKAETLALEQMKKLNAEYDKYASEDRTFKLDKVEREQGRAARLRDETLQAKTAVDSDTDAVGIIRGKIAKQNSIIKAGTSNRGYWDAKGNPVDTLDKTALGALRTRDDVLGPQLNTAQKKLGRDISDQEQLNAHAIEEQKKEDKEAADRARAAGAPAAALKKRQDQGVIGANKELGELSAKELSDTEKIKATRQAIQDQLNADGLLTNARLTVEQAITAELLKQYNLKLGKDAGTISGILDEQQIKIAERHRQQLLEDLEHSRDPHEFDAYNKSEAAKRVAAGDQADSDASGIRRQLQATIRANSTRGGGPGGAQGAAADLSAQLEAAKQILAIEEKRIAIWDNKDEKIRDSAAAQKEAAESVFQAEAQYEESLDELREKNLEKYHSDAVSIFDALTNRQVGAGRALAQLLKKDALSEGGTLFGNVVGPVLQHAGEGIAGAMPSGLGKILKGTIGDPANKAIPDAQTAIQTNTGNTVTALNKLVAYFTGKTSGDAAPSSDSSPDAWGGALANPLTGIIPALPPAFGWPGGLTNPMSEMAAMATASLPAALNGGPLGMIQKALGSVGGGIGSVFSGNALAMALGKTETQDASGNWNPMSTGDRIGAGVGLAGTLAAGAYGIVSGIHAGGAGGALTAAGSAAGVAGALIGNVATLLKATGPLLSAIPVIGSIAAIALPLIGSLFGNGPTQRANQISQELSANQYIAPQALNVTQSSNGNFTDFNARGQIRTSDFSAVPTVRQGSVWEQTHGLFGPPPTYYNVPGGQTGQFNPSAPAPVTNNYINAIDTQSFAEALDKHHVAVGNAAARNLQNVHGALAVEVHRTANG